MTARADVPVVAHVITQLEVGGAQRNTLHTVTHLDRTRFLPTLVCGPGGALDDEARGSSVPLVFCPALQRVVHPARDARALGQITAALSKHAHLSRAPLVVHTHSSKAGVLGRLAARRVRAAAVVHTVHGFGFHDHQDPLQRHFYVALEQVVAPLTHAWVFVSRRDLAVAQDLGLVPPGRGHVIRSGIDFSAFASNPASRARVRETLHVPLDAPLIITVGNFKPQKNPLGALDAFARIHARIPHAHWVLTGEGPLRERFEVRAGELGLLGHIHLLGWRQDIAALLQASDVFMLASTHEGLPRAVLESLASGVPVAATDAGGTHEVVVPGCGAVVRVGDMEALAAAACALLERPHPLPQAARQVLQEFDIRTMVARQQELYLHLLSQSPHASTPIL